ncbi:Uncharacterized protein Rs2_19515 [Raphanus sativus]|nr:Uncharacterized protein Rs2_19515 [Raphanus sativus]
MNDILFINYHLVWFFDFFFLVWNILELYPVPHFTSRCTFRMNCIARTTRAFESSVDPVNHFPTNTTLPVSLTKMKSMRDAMIMTVDANDSWQINAISVEHLVAFKTHVRITVAFQTTSVTSKDDQSRQ